MIISPIAGPLADKIFEPALLNPSNKTTIFLSRCFSPGAGAGMSLLLSIASIFIVVVGVYGYFSKHVRNVETLIPDFDAE